MDGFMRESDAFSWYMERDPALRSTVVSVVWLSHSPDWDVLRARVERATCLVPMFRKRVVELPEWLSTPRWTVDAAFDLGWHLRRIDAPAPHSAATVLEFAARCATTPFDHARPLWEFTLIEHLDSGGAAFVMKVHHALTDGVGGMELALLLFDTERDPDGPVEVPAAPAAERLDTATLVRESVARTAGKVLTFADRRVRGSVPAALETMAHPRARLEGALETWRSIARTVAPARQTLSPIMRARGIGRTFDTLAVDLEDMKRAAAAAGGTVNDAFVASVTGGLRRYHERHRRPVESLRVTLPISIRRPGDPPGGNRITLMRFEVPVSDPRPERRVADSHRLCHAASHERSLEFTNAIAGALNLLPPGVVRGMLKRVDFLTSDVPGFPFPVYLASAPVERFVAFGPTIGCAVNCLLLSYNGRCHVGVSMDTAAIADPDVFVDCLREGFEEVLGMAGAHDPVDAPFRQRALEALSRHA